MKAKIKIPLFGLKDYQKKIQLKELNDDYNNKYEFVESYDDLIHFDIVNNEENIFVVVINVNGMSRMKAQNKIYEIIEKYKIYTDCEFIYLPSNTEENKIIKLSNSNKIVDILH